MSEKMTARELLELAAKAAGIRIEIKHDANGAMYAWRPNPVWESWCPLTDDGDALRLAVDLGMIVYTNACAAVILMDDDSELAFEEEPGDDVRAATRRAIVRAAAEIGKAMP